MYLTLYRCHCTFSICFSLSPAPALSVFCFAVCFIKIANGEARKQTSSQPNSLANRPASQPTNRSWLHSNVHSKSIELSCMLYSIFIGIAHLRRKHCTCMKQLLPLTPNKSRSMHPQHGEKEQAERCTIHHLTQKNRLKINKLKSLASPIDLALGRHIA